MHDPDTRTGLPVWVPVKDAAAWLCVSKQTIHRLIDSGVLHGIRLGTKPGAERSITRVHRDSLEAL